jgi:hypothetical protein
MQNLNSDIVSFLGSSSAAPVAKKLITAPHPQCLPHLSDTRYKVYAHLCIEVLP